MFTSPQPVISFRSATIFDVPVITNLLNQLNVAEGNIIVMKTADVENGLFGASRKVPLRALLATESDRVIGAVLYYTGYDILTSVNGYHLGDLVVDSAYRRTGVGKKLFAALAQQNLEEGGEWISLTALSGNAPAVNFYKGIGMIDVPVKFFAAGKRILSELIERVQK